MGQMSNPVATAEPQRVRFLTYRVDGPAFRHRLGSAIPWLEARGVGCEVERLERRGYGWRLLRRRRQLRGDRAVVLSKVLLRGWEARLLSRLTAAPVLDVDDAIWLRRPKAIGQRPRDSAVRRRMLAATGRAATVVIAGNDSIARALGAAARRLEVIPTPVDTGVYPDPTPPEDDPVIVWIGRPENLVYLELVRPAFEALRRRWPGLRLRVVSSAAPDWPGVEAMPWSAAGEAAALATATVGIMPLVDDDWTRHKCAFKLLQYMAAGLPCVASPVGMNRDVVRPGESGHHAASGDDWRAALEDLLSRPEAARAMGLAGRARVRREFDTAVVAPRTVAAILGEPAPVAG